METDPAYTRILKPLFSLEDIELEVVDVPAKFVRYAADFDVLLMDISGGHDGDLAACADTIRRVDAPVHLFHPRENAVRRLQMLVKSKVVWLPADFQVMTMLDTLGLLKAAHDGFRSGDLPNHLTSREREVRDLMMQGLSYREIGATLAVSKSTVNTLAGRIIRKLGVSDRKQLVKFAGSSRSGLQMVYVAPQEKRMTDRTTKGTIERQNSPISYDRR